MRTGIPRIDNLAAGPPLAPGDGDRAAVGLVQDLLRGHGFRRLPDARGSGWGSFGTLTRQAVVEYRKRAGLGDSPVVDAVLLEDLARREARDPVACRGYMALALDCEYTPVLGLVALTSLFESGGRFCRLNCNTDGQGLSFGIIQWAQRPGRLHEILAAFCAQERAAFEEIAGGAEAARGLLEWTARPNGGVNPRTGAALDPRWSLIDEPWKGRFESMGRRRELQKVQLKVAAAAFEASLARLLPAMPLIDSERGQAFLLDLANQHGDAGARGIYRRVARAGMDEEEVLAAMAAESVRRVAAQYGEESAEAASTASRRAFFRTMAWV